MEWFRLYSDAVDDRKIRNIANVLGISHLEAFGAWCAVLCLANDSPVRGKLMLTESTPMPIRNVSETFRVTDDVTLRYLNAFASHDMLSLDNDTWTISNWNKRQFTSDNVTERVRKSRANKKSETLPERDRNVSETDQIQRQIQNQKQSTEPTTPQPPTTPDQSELLRLLGLFYGDGRVTPSELHQGRRWLENHGADIALQALSKAVDMGVDHVRSLPGFMSAECARLKAERDAEQRRKEAIERNRITPEKLAELEAKWIAKGEEEERLRKERKEMAVA